MLVEFLYSQTKTKSKYQNFLMQVAISPALDAKLSDICIGTSAAPTYLPAHYFENQDDQENNEEFNLIDGGLAANNPVNGFN